jgi:hypothetical protein
VGSYCKVARHALDKSKLADLSDEGACCTAGGFDWANETGMPTHTMGKAARPAIAARSITLHMLIAP